VPMSPGIPRIAGPRRLLAASARRVMMRVATRRRHRTRDADPECAAGAEAPLASRECCSIASRPPASRSRQAYPAGVQRRASKWCSASPGERFAAPEPVPPAGAVVPGPARSPAPDRVGPANRRPGLRRARRAQEQRRPKRGSPSEPLRCSPPSGTLSPYPASAEATVRRLTSLRAPVRLRYLGCDGRRAPSVCQPRAHRPLTGHRNPGGAQPRAPRYSGPFPHRETLDSQLDRRAESFAWQPD
jgi:hypothetical protein